MSRERSGPPPTPFGALLARRRRESGLSLRETARRVGISPGYLVSLERGLNPSTGRAPTPSLPILAALGRVLDVELATLLDAVGAGSPPSTHVMLYQAGAQWRSPLEAGRRLFGDRVEGWVEIVDPRYAHEAGAPAADVLVRGEGSLVSAPVYETGAVLTALAELLGDARTPVPAGRLGIVFGANSSVLRSIDNPPELLEGERTWENDVEATFRDVLGVAPVANVCVYRESDLEELSARFDPLTTVLELIRSHPHVAVQEASGVSIGAAAIEAILAVARPPGTSTETWRSLTRAAAAGLARESSLTHASAAGP